ncbi:MAG: ABC transporter substrate-binding protein [Eubacteriales bacterium]
MANATPALQAAAQGADTIPVLGTAVTEYGVALDIDNFDGLVGTNVSGTSDLAPLDLQQAAMLQELFPDEKNVGLLYCSAEANSQYQVDTVQAALEDLALTICKQYSFSDSNDLASVATTAANESDVIYLPTDNTVASNTEIVRNICEPVGVPIIAGEEGICAGCGVATLSISYYDLGVATGKMAVKILTGEANVSEMPIEYAPEFTKKYNPELAEAMGVTIPDDYVAIETAE